MPSRPSLQAADPREVRDQMNRILNSPLFASAPRMKRFLALVIDETLAGRSERLKEYTIGVEAFERPATFSPLADPIVRVEARRLRHKLARYYENHGQNEEVLIDVPKGGYVPSFSVRSQAAPTRQDETLIVRPFSAVNARAEAVREALLYELIDQFVRIRGFAVKTGSETLTSGLLLAGCVQSLPSGVRVVAQLMTTPQFDCRWSTAINRSASKAQLQSVAAAIATRVDAFLSGEKCHFGLS